MFGSRFLAGPDAAAREIALTRRIGAPPDAVLAAFFDPAALQIWWRAVRSVTTPRVLGPYVVEWAPTEARDDVLGRLGGVLRGTVVQYDAGCGFFVADLYWLPPDGDPIGPMALDVRCGPVVSGPAASTDLHFTQTGYEKSERWRRYYEVTCPAVEDALGSLKLLLEGRNGLSPHASGAS